MVLNKCWPVMIAVLLSAQLRAAEEQKPKVKPPTAARSVHLGYPISVPPGVKAEADMFYNEVVVEQSTPGTYFMSCGFRAGYFGIQELGRGRKVVLFSVWDPGKQDDPNSVKAEDRVKVLFKGEGVDVSRFGGEGTGGKSMFTYDWKLNEPQRFLVTSKADADSSTFAAYFYLNDKKEWKHLATFQTTARKTNLAGLYSFVEDFRRDTKSIEQPRRARFSNGWVRTLDGQGRMLEKAQCTADGTPLENNDAGVTEGNDFYLSTGGDAKRSRELRSMMQRKLISAQPPEFPAELNDTK